MRTKTYDLNLYIIDGRFKVLAHELETSYEGHIQASSRFLEALNIPLKRANRLLWEPILKFFGEAEAYNELDSWYGTETDGYDVPNCYFQEEELKAMPPVLATICEHLPEYEVMSWR